MATYMNCLRSFIGKQGKKVGGSVQFFLKNETICEPSKNNLLRVRKISTKIRA
jgi:hypothetical protein